MSRTVERRQVPLSTYRALKWQLERSFVDQEFEIPDGSLIVHVDTQDNLPTFWTLSPLQVPTEKRTFRVVMTGERFPKNTLAYHGTVLLHQGEYVVHLLEIDPEAPA